MTQCNRRFLRRRTVLWILLALTLLILISFHVDVPIRVYKSGIAQNPPRVTLVTPRWERLRQFLDNVDVYKITNEDPLAWTLSVLPPHPSGKIINNINPNVQPVTRMATRQNVLKSPTKPKLGRKRIVVVNNPGWDWIRMGDVGLTDCPVECTLTADTSHIQMADAIIFYAVGYFSTIPVRAHGQVWIFLSLESPSYSLSQAFEKPEWHGQINWTMTYRSDSDIFYPYGRVNRRGGFLTTDYTSLAEKKTKKVAWIVSHCETDSKREDYVRLLKQHIGVDTFGMCGLPCGNEGSFECLQMLTNDYKFYLSFENTLCLDYVTEKLFRKIMVADVVPVVRGFVNYTKYMPPKSFINADDFSTVAELGKYLNYLDKNMTAYLEYLEWRKYYFVVEKPNPTCEVCMKLLEPEKYRNVYEDVFSWWTKGVCHSPKPIV